MFSLDPRLLTCHCPHTGAFAAECRCCWAPGAVDRSPARTSLSSKPAAVAVERWERRMDGRPFVRPCSACGQCQQGNGALQAPPPASCFARRTRLVLAPATTRCNRYDAAGAYSIDMPPHGSICANTMSFINPKYPGT